MAILFLSLTASSRLPRTPSFSFLSLSTVSRNSSASIRLMAVQVLRLGYLHLPRLPSFLLLGREELLGMSSGKPQ